MEVAKLSLLRRIRRESSLSVREDSIASGIHFFRPAALRTQMLPDAFRDFPDAVQVGFTKAFAVATAVTNCYVSLSFS